MAGFCKKCGTALADNVKFCTNCGASTADGVDSAPAEAAAAPTPAPAAPVPAAVPVPAPFAPQQPAYQQPYQQAYPQPPRSNTGLIAALVGALVLIAALGTYLIMSRGNGETAAGGDNAAAGTTNVVGGAPVATGTPGAAPAQPYNGPTEGPAVGPEVVKYVTSDANIRSIATAQGNGSRVTGTLKRGVQVRGVMHQGLSGSHYWLKLSDGRGYVSAINLGDGPPAAAAPVASNQGRAPVANATYCTVVTRTGNLRIRSGPNGRIIGGMPPGARFQAYGGDYDAAGTFWVQVQPVEQRYPVGWVSADHVAC